MGKRSNFERKPRDCYDTPEEAFLPLLPHLPRIPQRVWEPCAGSGALMDHMENHVPDYDVVGSDLAPRRRDVIAGNVLEKTPHVYASPHMIITNPPWSRDILHPIITHCRNIAPTWLLIDADWMHTKQAAEFMQYCHKVVSIGRVKWEPGTKNTGKENACWYLFEPMKVQTQFFGREFNGNY